MKPTTGYALPYSDDRCFFLNKELYAFFIQTHEEESFHPADITLCAITPFTSIGRLIIPRGQSYQ